MAVVGELKVSIIGLDHCSKPLETHNLKKYTETVPKTVFFLQNPTLLIISSLKGVLPAFAYPSLNLALTPNLNLPLTLNSFLHLNKTLINF